MTGGATALEELLEELLDELLEELLEVLLEKLLEVLLDDGASEGAEGAESVAEQPIAAAVGRSRATASKHAAAFFRLFIINLFFICSFPVKRVANSIQDDLPKSKR